MPTMCVASRLMSALVCTLALGLVACASQDPRGLRGNFGATYASPGGDAPLEWSFGTRYYFAPSDDVPVLQRVRLVAGLDGIVGAGNELPVTSKSGLAGDGRYMTFGGRGMLGLAFYLGAGFTLLGRGEYGIGHAVVLDAKFDGDDPFVSASGGLSMKSVGGGAELVLGLADGFGYNFIFGFAYRTISFDGDYEIKVRDSGADDPGNRRAHEERVATYPGMFSLATELGGPALYLLMQF